MEIKAVVIDLDGTLLRSDKKISGRSLKAVEYLIKNQIPVIIATARPPRTVKYLLPEEIYSSAILIYYNGAMIVSEQLGINLHFAIDSVVSSDILDYLMKNEEDHWLSIEVEDKWYSYKDLNYHSIMKVKSNPITITLDELREMHPTKILLSNINSLDSLNRIFGNRTNIIHTDSKQLTQIMKKNISKEYAVNVISDKLGIPLDSIVVFGDDLNDLGLFMLCGYPVAMGNAVEELKDLAKEITETNDNDGVAKVLEVLFNYLGRSYYKVQP